MQGTPLMLEAHGDVHHVIGGSDIRGRSGGIERVGGYHQVLTVRSGSIQHLGQVVKARTRVS